MVRPGNLAHPRSDRKTSPAAGITPLPKTLLVDLDALAGMPDKIEGVSGLDATTVAVANDNDFDSEESKYDEQGNNIGKGKVSQILVIALDKPLPLDAK